MERRREGYGTTLYGGVRKRASTTRSHDERVVAKLCSNIKIAAAEDAANGRIEIMVVNPENTKSCTDLAPWILLGVRCFTIRCRWLVPSLREIVCERVVM